MQPIVPSRLLRAGLAIDAAGSGAIGLVHVAATATVARVLDAPAAIIVGSGVFMLVYAAALLLLARSGTLPRALVRFIVIGNGIYAAGCVLLALLLPGLNGAAIGHLVFQAVAVALFALLQGRGLARSQDALGAVAQPA
jgi:hypothetical protein